VEHPVTEQVAKIYLSEAFSEDAGNDDADVLVLGCTHYPLIKPLLRRVAPEHIAIVDSAESTALDVARQLGRQLQIEPEPSSAHTSSAHTKNELRGLPHLKFFATDSAEKFRKMGTRFLGLAVEDVVHVDLKE
jgi:glutamate racemase